MRRRCAEQPPLLLADLANYPRRCADDEAARFELLALGNECASADDATAFDHRAVQDSRAHADQAVIRDGAAVEDRLVTDGHTRADGQWEARIAVPNRAVLEITLSPMISGVLSPRSTAPNQTLAPAPRRTSPIKSADGAAHAPSPS